MSELSNLAAKYVRQRDHVMDLQRTVELAEANLDRETKDMDVTAQQLRDTLDAHKVGRKLIPISDKRFVLVQTINSTYGLTTSIDIIEEST